MCTKLVITMPQHNFHDLKEVLADFIRQEIGEPNYSYTLTFLPVYGSRRRLTKIMDATQSLRWFLRLLNDRCFGHSYRRKNIEVGFYATFEGLEIHEELHCHGAIRLPKKLSNKKFFSAFDYARCNTKRLGSHFDLKPYKDEGWIRYSLKTGIDSFQPEFLRRGVP
jgi:hypothetical protein